MVSSSEGWAVGLNGVILHYSGGVWSLYTSSPTTDNLYSVHMLNPDEGWAVGGRWGDPDMGTIFHYSDVGDQPTPVGGELISTKKLQVLIPYIALAGLIMALSTVYVFKRRKD
jgi:photosystem II stability/assembly factor-like uncharacterized protein